MKYRPSPLFRQLRGVILTVERDGLLRALKSSFQTLFKAIKKRGLIGACKRVFATPAPVQVAAYRQPHPFDVEHGTDTDGYISSAEFTSVSFSALFGTGYAGIPSSTLRPALAALPIRHEDFTFVDIGCGKGRALLVAAEFPFRRLIGVEIAVELSDIARANVALKPTWQERISIVNEDATAFEFPDGPLVLFLYHSFTSLFLPRFLTKLERQLRRSPRPAFIIDADMYTADLKANFGDTSRCRTAMLAVRSLREISDMNFPLSPDEAAVELTGGQVNRFTLFALDVPQ